MAFDDEVRRVAEAVWSLQPGECTPAWYDDDPVLHELDGVARLPDVTHMLMATTSRRLDKVKDDVKKLNIAAEKEEAPRPEKGRKMAHYGRPVGGAPCRVCPKV